MKKLDYICSMDNVDILIETVQKDVRSEVVQKYKKSRKSKGITQTELSRLTGIAQPNITRFESGTYNPTLGMMVRIAEALGMDLKIELIDRNGEDADENN